MSHKCNKLSVDNVTREGDTFIASVWGAEDCHDRQVTVADLLTHLFADKQGRIPQVSNPGEIDESHWTVDLDTWLDEAGISGLEYELQTIINLREGRNLYNPKPIPDLSDIGATITHLTSTIPNVKTANAA